MTEPSISVIFGAASSRSQRLNVEFGKHFAKKRFSKSKMRGLWGTCCECRTFDNWVATPSPTPSVAAFSCQKRKPSNKSKSCVKMNEAATALGTTPPTPLAPTHTHDTSHPHPYIKSDSSSEKNVCSVPKYSWDRVQPKDRANGGVLKKFRPQNAWKFICHKKYIIMWETIVWLRRTSVLLTRQLSTFVKVFPIFVCFGCFSLGLQFSCHFDSSRKGWWKQISGVELPSVPFKLYWQAWNESLAKTNRSSWIRSLDKQSNTHWAKIYLSQFTDYSAERSIYARFNI